MFSSLNSFHTVCVAFRTREMLLTFRFQETQPVFVRAMVDFLKECCDRANRPTLVQAFMSSATRKYQADIDLMRGTAKESRMSYDSSSLVDSNILFIPVIAERRAHPSDKQDLLSSMLGTRDPKTGQVMTEESIVNNVGVPLINVYPHATSYTFPLAAYFSHCR